MDKIIARIYITKNAYEVWKSDILLRNHFSNKVQIVFVNEDFFDEHDNFSPVLKAKYRLEEIITNEDIQRVQGFFQSLTDKDYQDAIVGGSPLDAFNHESSSIWHEPRIIKAKYD